MNLFIGTVWLQMRYLNRDLKQIHDNLYTCGWFSYSPWTHTCKMVIKTTSDHCSFGFFSFSSFVLLLLISGVIGSSGPGQHYYSASFWKSKIVVANSIVSIPFPGQSGLIDQEQSQDLTSNTVTSFAQ